MRVRICNNSYVSAHVQAHYFLTISHGLMMTCWDEMSDGVLILQHSKLTSVQILII